MATVESRLKNLENKQCCCKHVFKDTFAEFPPEGSENRIYIDRSTGDIYVWDGANYITSDNSIVSINSTQNVPYTGVELPVDDGITVGDTSAVQFSDGTIVFYTWDGNAWVVDFVDNASISGAGVASKVAFWTDANTLDSDTNLHWDDVNKRLGIGTATPTQALNIFGAENSTFIAITPSSTIGGWIGLRLNATNTGTERGGMFINPASGEIKIGATNAGGYFPTFYTSSGEAMRISASGNVGIGTTTPSTKLHVLSADNTTAVTVAIGATQANVTASDVFVAFTSTSGTEGSIAGTAVAGVIAYNTFTGSHYSQSNDIEQKPIKVVSYQKGREYKETIKEEGTWEDGVFKEGEVIFEDTVGEEVITEVEVDAYDTTLIPGTVLCSTNEMCQWQGEDNATLPKCRVSDSPMDKAVYGVYGGHDRDGDIFVLGIGTGVALVNEEGGKIEIGDFLCTSSTPGQAMRYDGNDMRVVLAKARENFEGESRAIAVTLLAG